MRQPLAIALVAGLCLAAGPAMAAPERLVGHGGPVKAVVTEAGGDLVLTASFDYSAGLWQVNGEGYRLLHRLIGHEAAVNDVAFIPGGDRAISVSDDGSAIVWDLTRGSMLARFGQEVAAKALDVEVTADGRLAAVAKWDRTVLLIDLERLEVLAALTGNRDRVNAVAFSADGSRLYSGGGDGSVRLWQLPLPADGGAPPQRVLHEQGWGLNVVEWVPGGVVIGSVDGSLQLISDAGARREIYFFQRPVMAAVRSDDGRHLAASAGDGEILVFDTASWAVEKELLGEGGPVWGLAFGDDGGLWLSGLDDEVYRVALQGPPEPLPEPAEQPRRFHLGEGLGPGAREFQRKCSVCHTLTADDANRAGPTLYRLFGRRAGSLPGYPYSPALKHSTIVWTEETVAQLFHYGPDILAPGTKMPIQRIKDPERRAALIAFLKSATGGAAPEDGKEQE